MLNLFSRAAARRLAVSASAICIVALAAIALPSAASAATGTVNISGEVGETVDPDATNGGFFLRYVGDPPPAETYSHSYQWGEPYITTQPEDDPIVFDGTLDLTDRENGDVSMIGLLDNQDLAAGNHSFQRGAYIYVFAMTSGNVRVGVTDGNSGGEIVQAFVTIPAAVADSGPLATTFTVDGTADPASCATPPGSGTGAAGCLTLEINGATISDSYGTIRGTASSVPEFSASGVPGWEAFPSGPTGVFYDFSIMPADFVLKPQTKDDCKKGGYEEYGFENQGQCVRFVETGKDSRP